MARLEDAMDVDWVQGILRFWFEELTPEDWYTGKEETDRAIAERFRELHDRLAVAVPTSAWTDADAALAAIILFDQFPRNMFRRRPEAFASDKLALELARNAVDKGFDTGLPPERQQFFYMPFQHSEVLSDQERGVSLFKSLGNDEGLKYALEHRDIILRFGRFPHRNRVLGRDSTAEENAFMEAHAGYGQ
jgi:uncharacterized protein (DUF924 family)